MTLKRGLLTYLAVLLVFVAISIYCPHQAQAATFNVTDAATLQDALDTAAVNNQNNTINLASGTYTGDFVSDNTSGRSLTLNGHSQSDTFIIDATGDTMVLNTNGPLTIQNLTFKDSVASGLILPGSVGTNTNNFIVNINHVSFTNNTSFGIQINPYVGAQGGSVTITDSTFDRNIGAGVNFSNTGSSFALPLTFKRNTMTNGGYGIHVETNADGSDMVFDRNYSANNSEQWGVGISVITDCLCKTTFTSNVIVNNKGNGNTAGVGVVYESRGSDAGGQTLLNFTNNTIANNVESDTNAGGLLATIDTPNAIFNLYNNIFWNNSIVGGGDNGGNDVYFNLSQYGRIHFLNNDIHSLQLDGSLGNYVSSNNIDADPLFQQISGARTFQNVAQQSPVVGMGANNAPGLPTADFAGIALRNSPDIGAFTLNVVAPASLPPQTSVHIASCSTAPAASPDLFQINTAKKEATLYFAPLQDASNYLISYGLDRNANQFSVMTGLGQSSGVLSYTVRALPSMSTMYFKVYAQNNCGQGNWSNTMSIKEGTSMIYYKNSSSQYTSSQTTVLGAKTGIIEPSLIVPSPSTAPLAVATTKASQPQSKTITPEVHKKSCFLFLCF